MNELQLGMPELFFIYQDWYGDFKEDIQKHYWSLNTYHSVMGSGSKVVPQFESVVDLSEEWLFRVCSQEHFGDPKEYLSLDILKTEQFYGDCRSDAEFDFKQDLFAVLISTNLVFGTKDNEIHNVPIKAVW